MVVKDWTSAYVSFITINSARSYLCFHRFVLELISENRYC